MYIKDINGNWCKVEESNLKSKQIDIQEAKELIVAERAEKRKKILDFLNALDNDELEILQCNLSDKMQSIPSSARQGSWRSSNSPDRSCSELFANYFDCSIGDA
jgi:hypothetical protein